MSDQAQEQVILEKTIRAAANIVAKVALELIEKDPHQWSARPCATCSAVSVVIGEPFGCVKYRNIDKIVPF